MAYRHMTKLPDMKVQIFKTHHMEICLNVYLGIGYVTVATIIYEWIQCKRKTTYKGFKLTVTKWCNCVAMDTNVGWGFPVASQVSVMSSAEKVVIDSGWAVITGGVFTAERVHHTQNIQLPCTFLQTVALAKQHP